jgi:hypothetical protein
VLDEGSRQPVPRVRAARSPAHWGGVVPGRADALDDAQALGPSYDSHESGMGLRILDADGEVEKQLDELYERLVR